MDVRPTPEQRELELAATRLADRLGPSTAGDLDDAARRARLDAAMGQAGWRELRAGTRDTPLASGVEAAIVARCLAQRVCDSAFIGPVLAADLARRASVEDGPAPMTIAVGSRLAHVGDVNAGESLLAIDLRAASTHWRCRPRPAGSTLLLWISARRQLEWT